jgi:hypothetical protein
LQIELYALRDPFPQQLVVGGIDIHAHAAHVRDRAGRFEQQQALIGIGPIESAGADVVREGAVIVQRVVPAER